MSNENPPTALYRKMKTFIQGRIKDGDWCPGDRVVSEANLVRDFGVSRMTANRALRELAAEGWLTRIQGVGTFVSEPPAQSEIVRIRSIAEEIRERGHSHRSVLCDLKKTLASEAVAKALGVKPGARVFHSMIVHYENDIPIQVEDRFVNPAIAPDYLAVDFSRTTPNEYLVRVAPIGQVRHVIEAVRPSARIQKLLKISRDEPCLCLFRLTWTWQIAASCAWLTHPGSLYRMVAQFMQPFSGFENWQPPSPDRVREAVATKKIAVSIQPKRKRL
jgi:GntR family transcriptional regulator, histidine utilization repressor